MTHEDLKNKLLKAMGGKVPMSARDTWADFLRSRATEFFMNYDWVKHPAFWKWVYEDPRVDGGLGGTYGTTIMIMEHGRIGHERPAV